MVARDKIDIGKDDSYFEGFEITETGFQEECDSIIKIRFVNNLYFINTGTEVIEYSFNGTTLHGDMTPGTNTAFLSFPNRFSSKIWFRAPNGPSTVKVGAYVSNDFSGYNSPISQVTSVDIALRFATISEDGYELTLTYNTPLDTGSTPSSSAFSLTGTSASPDSVLVTGFSVVITLDAQVLYNETVTVSYTAGGSPIRDTEENNAENLVNESVTNNSEIGELPTLVSAVIPTNGLTVTLTYDEALNASSTPSAGSFSLSGTSATPSSVLVSSNTVTVTLNLAVQYNETVTISYTAGVNPIEDLFGNNAANLSNQATTNNSQIGELPTLVSATIPTNGFTVVLVYDEALNESSTPAAGDFSLAGTSAEPDSVDISGTTVTITLDAAVEYDETVTIDYTAGSNPIEDLFGNNAANLNDQAITNNSEIGELPTLVSAVIPTNGLSVVLTYDESLNTSSTPSAGSFSLAGTSATPSSVLVSGSTVTITLGAPAQAGETVTLDYTAGVNPIEDLFGNNAANLTNSAVTNNSAVGGGDVIAPVIQTKVVGTNGATLVLTYDETLNSGSVPATGDFSVSGTVASIASVGVSGDAVTLTFGATPVQVGETLTVSYTAGSNPIEDLAGNNAANLTNSSVTNNSTQDTIAPVLQTAVINSAGNSLTLTYNESLNTGSTPATGAFSLAGTSAAVTNVNVTGSTVVLTLSPVVQAAETVTVSYTAGGSPIEDVAGNNAANLSNQATTNNSTQDTVAPTISSIIALSSGTSVELTYNENLNTGSTPAVGDFSLSGTSATITSVGVSGAVVTLTLGIAIVAWETVTLSYTAGSNPIEDVAGNNAANLSSSAVTNNSTNESDVYVNTFFANDTFTSSSRVGTCSIFAQGAGAGGTTDTRAGGGGASALVNAFARAVSTGYSVVVGAAGSGGGSPTAGGNSTFNTTTCVAEGGGQSGTLSDGGRAANSTGDVTRDGGAGGVGTGNQNGGSSAGSGSAASGNTPGDPDGAKGATANNNNSSKNPGGGGRSSATNGFTGSIGSVRVTDIRDANASFPLITGIQQGRDTSGQTSRDVSLPTGQTGDLLVIFWASGGNPTVSMPGGDWSSAGTSASGTACSGGCFYKTASGSDSVALETSATEVVNWVVMRLKHAGTPTATYTNNTTANINPPNHAPGSGDYLWFVHGVAAQTTTTGSITAFPTNYQGIYVPCRTNAADCAQAIVWRQLNASSEDPGTFTSVATGGWVGGTISIPRV